MIREELLARFERLITWSSGGQRAPHKPLLVLLALGEWTRGNESLLFSEIRQPLTDLLISFGPDRKVQHPEYSFWRLQTDHVWKIRESQGIQLTTDKTPTAKMLVEANARGEFTDDIQATLKENPVFVGDLARAILNAHFPDSLHQDILNSVGLELTDIRATGGGRDPNFRRAVLNAYSHRCAVCGFQVLLSGKSIALEAAHIQWHQASGPAILQNGIALCVMHHKVFDLGAFTITADYKVIISDLAGGLAGFEENLLTFHGKKLLNPIHENDQPHPRFIEWHGREVFRGKARP